MKNIYVFTPEHNESVYFILAENILAADSFIKYYDMNPAKGSFKLQLCLKFINKDLIQTVKVYPLKKDKDTQELVTDYSVTPELITKNDGVVETHIVHDYDSFKAVLNSAAKQNITVKCFESEFGKEYDLQNVIKQFDAQHPFYNLPG